MRVGCGWGAAADASVRCWATRDKSFTNRRELLRTCQGPSSLTPALPGGVSDLRVADNCFAAVSGDIQGSGT